MPFVETTILGRVGNIRGDLIKVDQGHDPVEDRGVLALLVGGESGNREFSDLVVEEMNLALRLFFSALADQADQRAVKVDLVSAVLAVGGSLRHSVELLVVVVEREGDVDRVGLRRTRIVGLGRGTLDGSGDHDAAVAERVDALEEGRESGLARLVVGDFDDLLATAARRHQASGQNENEAKQKRKKSGFHCLFFSLCSGFFTDLPIGGVYYSTTNAKSQVFSQKAQFSERFFQDPRIDARVFGRGRTDLVDFDRGVSERLAVSVPEGA